MSEFKKQLLWLPKAFPISTSRTPDPHPISRMAISANMCRLFWIKWTCLPCNCWQIQRLAMHLPPKSQPTNSRDTHLNLQGAFHCIWSPRSTLQRWQSPADCNQIQGILSILECQASNLISWIPPIKWQSRVGGEISQKNHPQQHIPRWIPQQWFSSKSNTAVQEYPHCRHQSVPSANSFAPTTAWCNTRIPISLQTTQRLGAISKR